MLGFGTGRIGSHERGIAGLTYAGYSVVNSILRIAAHTQWNSLQRTQDRAPCRWYDLFDCSVEMVLR